MPFREGLMRDRKVWRMIISVIEREDEPVVYLVDAIYMTPHGSHVSVIGYTTKKQVTDAVQLAIREMQPKDPKLDYRYIPIESRTADELKAMTP